MTTIDGHAEQELVRIAARYRVEDLALNRAIYRASHEAGLSQRQISARVGGHSQATIQRILARFAENPALLQETPAEVIDKRDAGLIDAAAMMETLLNWPYTFGDVPHVDGVATDSYTTGKLGRG
ncbi:winged helix-turn-helix domain-containing protein [Speluncibacter jeojiensis]|uniref:Winged helix-turn-helix domain-containing protein n=1 Tax=Speluncibacter jeojiensis TaxID=2710754 RepID=A0A9X4M365_9ACTN|nr:winged helix-turn-helix domain-containing protein [Corynebacteriales bacterium D3-21]